MNQRLPPFSAAQLQQSITSLPAADCWLVGFSGGADSTALMHALVELRGQLDTPFRAVHINHGLHPESNQWQRHCETVCRDWSVPLTCLTVLIDGSGQGLEAEARERRYAAIKTLLQPGEAVLTAHHADDQAETVLLNLMRGSGVDGLSAMPERKTFGQHLLLRPLLKFHRQALLEYLRFSKIEWLEDPSNQNLSHDRNFIRHSVLPQLESRFKGTVQRLLLTQQAMAEARSLLASVATGHLQTELLHPQVLHASESLLADAALFKLVVRQWLKQSEVAGLPARRLNNLYTQLQQVGTDNQASVVWAGTSMRFYQNCLWLQQATKITPFAETAWPDRAVHFDLDHDVGSLSFASETDILPPGKITITNRHCRPGLSLLRGEHHQSVKNVFQSASIPTWLRDCIPMTLIDNELVAVGDWAINTTFASWLSENHVKLIWQPDDPILQFVASQQLNLARLK